MYCSQTLLDIRYQNDNTFSACERYTMQHSARSRLDISQLGPTTGHRNYASCILIFLLPVLSSASSLIFTLTFWNSSTLRFLPSSRLTSSW